MEAILIKSPHVGVTTILCRLSLYTNLTDYERAVKIIKDYKAPPDMGDFVKEARALRKSLEASNVN